MRHLRVKGAITVVVSIALLVTSTAIAETEQVESRVMARRMAEEASNLYDSGQYEPARDLFHRANQLYPAPTLELWEARSLDKLGRLIEAEERYSSVQHYLIRPDDSDVVRVAVEEASIEIEQLRERIPTLLIVLHGVRPDDPNVQVHVDAKRLKPARIGFPNPVDVGKRTVRLVVKGQEVQRVEVDVKEGDHRPVELDAGITQPKPLAKPVARAAATDADSDRSGGSAPWYARPTLGWISVGVGAVGLGFGITTGVVAISKHKDLEERCVDNRCSSEDKHDLASFRAYRTASTVGYVVGGIGLAAGGAVLLVAPRLTKKKTVALELTPTSVGLAATF